MPIYIISLSYWWILLIFATALFYALSTLLVAASTAKLASPSTHRYYYILLSIRDCHQYFTDAIFPPLHTFILSSAFQSPHQPLRQCKAYWYLVLFSLDDIVWKLFLTLSSFLLRISLHAPPSSTLARQLSKRLLRLMPWHGRLLFDYYFHYYICINIYILSLHFHFAVAILLLCKSLSSCQKVISLHHYRFINLLLRLIDIATYYYLQRMPRPQCSVSSKKVIHFIIFR